MINRGHNLWHNFKLKTPPVKVVEILPILINRKVDLGEICIMKPTCRWDFRNKSQKFYKQL